MPTKSLSNLRPILVATCLLALTKPSQSFGPFKDWQTLNEQDGDSSQVVEHLGRVIKLRTAVAHHSSFPCTFTIQTRTSETEVEFSPGWHCLLEVCGDYKFDLQKLAASNFDPKLRTIIFVPGYLSDAKVDWIDRASRLWLAIEDVNVIKVSWANGNRYLYSTAVSGTPIVAREITILLHHLAGLNGLNFTEPGFANKIHIVGHSLGAHIGSFVGQDLGARVSRITGLDPAGVFFDMQPRYQRLDKNDARLVDVIHTNSGKMRYHELGASALPAGLDCLMCKIPGLNKVYSRMVETMGESYSREANTSWFGINQQVGHIDYYANDGRVQPGCESYLHVCDHGRSVEIYVDFLAFEYNSRRSQQTMDRKANRLLAFKSEDYDSFFVGSNLISNCKSILNIDPQSRHDLKDTIKSCSLPMDFTGQVDDLIEEYSRDYGIKSFPKSVSLPESKYYFMTRGSSPLVGNHFMLIIYPWSVLGDWKQKCNLKVVIEHPGGLNSTQVTMLRDHEKPAGFGYSDRNRSIFSALFTMPSNGSIPEQLLKTSGNQHPIAIDWQAQSRLLLPQSIKMSISSVGVSHSVAKAVANKIWGYFSVKSRADKCAMMIDSVDIILLVGSERTFVGHYVSSESKAHLSADTELSFSMSSVDFTIE